ncbi:MAG: hypothetical protein MUO33_06560, partial [Sedimentisphaerales bacterium]|nr:hypothetical protein [Sedimentisphaerales bacterium]
SGSLNLLQGGILFDHLFLDADLLGLTAEHAESTETKNIKTVFSAVSALSAVKKPEVCAICGCFSISL